MGVESEINVDISEALLGVGQEVRGVFDGLRDEVARVERVHDRLLEVLVVGLPAKVGEVHTVEEGLVPEVGFVAHFLGWYRLLKVEWKLDQQIQFVYVIQ